VSNEEKPAATNPPGGRVVFDLDLSNWDKLTAEQKREQSRRIYDVITKGLADAEKEQGEH